MSFSAIGVDNDRLSRLFGALPMTALRMISIREPLTAFDSKTLNSATCPKVPELVLLELELEDGVEGQLVAETRTSQLTSELVQSACP